MATRRAAPLKVLFVGNSFTARNDLPGLVARLAAARGRRLEHRLISAGGASLRMHWNKGEAPKAIREGGYDYVVLQEQSTLPIKNAARFHENVRQTVTVAIGSNAAGRRRVPASWRYRRNHRKGCSSPRSAAGSPHPPARRRAPRHWRTFPAAAASRHFPAGRAP